MSASPKSTDSSASSGQAPSDRSAALKSSPSSAAEDRPRALRRGLPDPKNSERGLSTLVAGVANEVNSPLQVITGVSESLLRRLEEGNIDPNDLRRRLEAINRNAWRAAGIVRAQAAFAHASAQLLEPDDLPSLAEQIALTVTQTFGFPDCGVLLVDESETTLELVTRAGDFQAADASPLPLDGPGLTVAAARSGGIVYAPDVSGDPRHLANDPRTRSELVAPLCGGGGRVIGVLDLQSPDLDAFDERGQRVVSAFAERAALALENARLLETERRRREMAAALLDIAQVASSSLKLKQVLKRVTQRTAEACRANRCSILLLDETKKGLQPVMSQFADGHVDLEQWQTFKTTTVDRVDTVPLFRDAVRERRPTLLDDPARTDLVPRAWTQPFGIQKMLAVPLISRDRVIGLMVLDHTDARREFTPDQIDLALTIAGQVAASIENAQLYARTQQLAITDGLTGLYNNRHFYQTLEKELRRSRRYGHPCSLLMLDLDDFKRYNDRYGHLAGDDLLRELVGLIRDVVRQADTPARYGGEEFAVILPETDQAQALTVAERLREVVRTHEFIVREERVGRITLSAGVATCPEDAQDVEGLVHAADMALLRAKAEKDRVCTAGND